MVVRFKSAGGKNSSNAFTLLEVLICFVILTVVMSGLITGYVQANRVAEWSSESLAAMSYAEQGMEQLRSAQWSAEEYPTGSGSGTTDVLGSNFTTNQSDSLDIPSTGAPIYATNTMSSVQVSSTPPLRLLTSQVIWTFTLTGQTFTNTIVTLRAPDQLQ